MEIITKFITEKNTFKSSINKPYLSRIDFSAICASFTALP